MACSPQAQGATKRGEFTNQQPLSPRDSCHKRSVELALGLTQGTRAPHSANTTHSQELMFFHRMKLATQKSRATLWKAVQFALHLRGEINKD